MDCGYCELLCQDVAASFDACSVGRRHSDWHKDWHSLGRQLAAIFAPAPEGTALAWCTWPPAFPQVRHFRGCQRLESPCLCIRCRWLPAYRVIPVAIGCALLAAKRRK